MGHARTLINNMVEGVTKGFEQEARDQRRRLSRRGQGKNLQLQLGYSHDVVYPIPEGIAIVTPKPTEIVDQRLDKQKVGQVAAEIRALRPPEPYKGKGIKYRREHPPQGRQEEVRAMDCHTNDCAASTRRRAVRRRQANGRLRLSRVPFFASTSTRRSSTM